MVTRVYFKEGDSPVELKEGDLLTNNKNNLGFFARPNRNIIVDPRMTTELSPEITAAVCDMGNSVDVYSPQDPSAFTIFSDDEWSSPFWPNVEKVVHTTPVKK